MRGKFVGDNERVVFEINEDESRSCVIEISHVNGLPISGDGDLILFIQTSRNGYGVKVLWVDEAIYLRMGITKVPYVFIDYGDIFGGTNTFSGLSTSAVNCAGGIQDIKISPGRAHRMEEPLTREENSP